MQNKGQLSRRQWLQGIGALWLLSISKVGTAASAPLLAARIWPSKLYTRLTLESVAALQYRHFELFDPHRLVIDIDNLALNRHLQHVTDLVRANDPFISRIRVGQFTPTTLRIVIELKQPVRADIFTLKPVASFRHRLVIDLYPATVTQSDPLMAFLSQHQQQTQTTLLPPKLDQPNFIVMIDPGHGGEDPGAHGLRRTKEKDVVLVIAKRLQRLIERQPNMKALMTRSDDIFIPLAARVAKARRQNANIFVSIHADAFKNRKARGSSVFTLSTRGASSAAARYLAETQNESDLIGGVSRSGDRYVDNTLLEMMQRQTMSDSLQLAQDVLQQMKRINHLHKNRVEQAGFAVLKAPEIPSILVETAFISHPEEERKLRTAHYQQQVAEAILAGIKRYLAGQKKGT